jgi:EAL domain-containing protein (putative c-di-GMP-specific phosphodiesterase class I)/CHASE2 domain-containing sensor protein
MGWGRKAVTRLKALRRGGRSPRRRVFVWSLILGLIFGAIEFGQPLEDVLRTGRDMLHPHKASGDIVVVGIDDRSIAEVGSWPWLRSTDGRMLDQLKSAGARRVFFDLDFAPHSTPREDQVFAAAIKRHSGDVVLAARFLIDPSSGQRTDNLPPPMFSEYARLGNINVHYNHNGIIWKAPYGMKMAGRDYPSFASLLSGVAGRAGDSFPIDYSLDTNSIRVISAVDVLRGRVPSGALAGKDVIIALTSLQLGDVYLFPGRSRMPGVYVHVLAAETLRAGPPLQLGWLPAFLLAAFCAGLAVTRRKHRWTIVALASGEALFVTAPLALEPRGICVDVVPAIFLCACVAFGWSWSTFRHSLWTRGTTNAVSGLPNLVALREHAPIPDHVLIAARVHNYPEITSALPTNEEQALVEQVARRLTLGAAEGKLYHGDEGIFAWLTPRGRQAELGDHLEALHALFRTPVIVGERQIDMSVTFGVEIGDRSLGNRLSSALVAADEAAHAGQAWRQYDPAKLQDAEWKLSLLSQLDSAIEAGHLWVAYQPMLDVRSGQIEGAEALVRWSHPERGLIAPDEFIPAAEQSDRIEKLTGFVLSQAIRAAAMINRHGVPFKISVNLSARLIGSSAIEEMVERMLREHGLPAERLTLEVTETAALSSTAAASDTLGNLRKRGVRISIDDYGTGLSTLEYLRRIPATEIKIDKSFVQLVQNSRSDRLMVHSTIQLAHSLGHRVVAEGVEDSETLDALISMGCDTVQGFHIGKPMKFLNLNRILMHGTARKVA